MDREEAPQRLVGKVLDGRYRVTSVLGAGGMGAAYLATDERLNRQVVVKVPLERFLALRQFRARFLDETRQLIKLDHPNIVKVYDGGEADGLPYVVLQHLTGGSLEDLLTERGGRIGPTEVLEWLPTVAGALDFIHQMEILHRDVKPGNILFDGAGHAVLADFGIAKALGGVRSAQETLPGVLVGSPAFMAPEYGRANLGPAYDQYALAVAAYLALSGELPHGQADDPFALLAIKTVTSPRPLSGILPHAAGQVSDSVMRAISPAPEDRYASCAEFAEAFERGVREQGPEQAGQRVFAVARAATAARTFRFADCRIEVPPLLPYLTDRSIQKDELDSALRDHRGHKPHRPFVALIHGDELEAHDRFVDQLQQQILPDLLQLEPIHLVKFPWSDSTGSIPERKRHLERNLAQCLVGRRDVAGEELAQEVASHRTPVMISTFVSSRDWLRNEPELIRSWLADWGSFPGLPHGQLLLVFLSVRYWSVSVRAGEGSGRAAESVLTDLRQRWAMKRGRKRTMSRNENVRAFLEGLDFSEMPGTTGVRLTPLRGIRESHVEEWIESEVNRFCRETPRVGVDPVLVGERLKPWVSELFAQRQRQTGSDRIPMSSLAPDLRQELLRCLNEGGC